jgi:hypothetical protein
MVETLCWMLERMKVLVEPSGVAGAAAVRHRKADFSGSRVGVILSAGIWTERLAGFFAVHGELRELGRSRHLQLAQSRRWSFWRARLFARPRTISGSSRPASIRPRLGARGLARVGEHFPRDPVPRVDPRIVKVRSLFRFRRNADRRPARGRPGRSGRMSFRRGSP